MFHCSLWRDNLHSSFINLKHQVGLKVREQYHKVISIGLNVYLQVKLSSKSFDLWVLSLSEWTLVMTEVKPHHVCFRNVACTLKKISGSQFFFIVD